MMLNETYTKNIQPRDPERIRSDIETPCATVYNQGVTPVLYDNLIQLVPVLGLIMAAVWSFSPNSGINKRTISRALLIVQCIVLAVVCVFWCINYGFHG